MSQLDLVLAVIKTATLGLGGLITVLSYRAYRRTRAAPLRALSVGFALVTLGALLAGMVHQFTSLGLTYSVVLESTLTLLGFAVITYSLYAE
ncbi:MAG: hypothetical protein ABEJ82_02660 [Haloplanus sp.]